MLFSREDARAGFKNRCGQGKQSMSRRWRMVQLGLKENKLEEPGK
jgi:hypothetical protein